MCADGGDLAPGNVGPRGGLFAQFDDRFFFVSSMPPLPLLFAIAEFFVSSRPCSSTGDPYFKTNQHLNT